MTRDRSSVAAVGRVQRLDGSARVLQVWCDATSGWEPSPVGRLTPDALEALRDTGVRIVRLRRHWHVADVSLAWFPATAAPAALSGPGFEQQADASRRLAELLVRDDASTDPAYVEVDAGGDRIAVESVPALLGAARS